MATHTATRWDRDLLFNTPSVCSERAKLVTESYRETEGLPAVMRLARAFENTLSRMNIYIEPNHLIVGNLASSPVTSPIWPEFGVSWLDKELDNIQERPFEKFIVTEAVKTDLREIIPYWKRKGREDIIVDLMNQVIPEYAKEAFDPEAYGIRPALYGGYNKASGGAGHTIINYEKVLKSGLGRIIQEAQDALAVVDNNDKDAFNKVIFLKSVIISLNAAINVAKRYSKLAETLAQKEMDERRRRELKKISEVCNWIPEKPARTYWEAIQAIWFIHLLRWVESNGHSVSIGRLDILLYPYYISDITEGRLTRGEAEDLLENLFIKICGVKRLRPWTDTQYKSGYVTFQAITVGGQTKDGHDFVNELSYLILEVTAKLKLPEPVVICRVHAKTSDEFLVKSVEALVKHGGGLPGFFGDEAIIPAMLSEGRPLAEARDYAIVPCPSPAVAGRHIDNHGGGIYLNLPKVLEMTLHGGKDPESGLSLFTQDKDLSSFESYEELWNTYKQQIRNWLRFVPLFNSISASLYASLNPAPFASAFIDYRIEMGKDMNEGGGPIKDFGDYQQGHGLANAANSLAAIKKLVFEDKKITGEDLKDALLANFENAHGADMRNMLLKAPKYGNDDDYVDLIAVELTNYFCDEVKNLGTTWRGGSYLPTFEGTSGNVAEGLVTGATPDGRKRGEALADNISPMAGTDVQGVTTMLRSIGKLDHSKARHGNILNVKFHPTALRGEGVKKLADLIRTYLVDLKGWQIQFNILSADTLRDAQEHPEKYRDLVVKVAGYCAQFIHLDKKLQDQIILRTENVL